MVASSSIGGTRSSRCVGGEEGAKEGGGGERGRGEGGRDIAQLVLVKKPLVELGGEEKDRKER